MERSPFDAAQIEDVILGSTNQAGEDISHIAQQVQKTLVAEKAYLHFYWDEFQSELLSSTLVVTNQKVDQLAKEHQLDTLQLHQQLESYLATFKQVVAVLKQYEELSTVLNSDLPSFCHN